MKKIFVNIFIFFVSLALFLSPVDVYAYNDNPWHNTLEDVQRFLGYLGCQIGALGNHDYTGFIDNMETFNAWCDNGYVDLREDGSIVASDQLVDDLKEYLDSYFKETSDHWYEQPLIPSDFYTSNTDGQMANAFSNLCGTMGDYIYGICFDAGRPPFDPLNELPIMVNLGEQGVAYFVKASELTHSGDATDGGAITHNHYYMYDRYGTEIGSSLKGTSYRFDKELSVYSVNTSVLNVSVRGRSANFFVTGRAFQPEPRIGNYSGTRGATNIVSSTRTNVLCFKDEASLRRYIYGTPISGNTYYATTNYTNYNPSIDNSVTIDKSTVEYILNTENNFFEEISNVTSSIQTEISNYYTENNTTMSNTQIQQTIDNSVHNYITSLPSGGNTEDPDKPPVDPDNPNPPGGDVSGNNPGGTVSGGSISGNGVDGPQTVSLLSKIYSKLCEVYDFLSGAILDALKSIKNAIVANTLVDVAGGIADLISGGLDAVGGFMDDTVEAFAPVAEMLPEKFPTCIPWDLIAIFTVIVSSGSPPVYEVPVSIPRLGIDYTLTLDLSIFEPVAILCRAFLSLLMVMMLIHMTIRLTSGGDN